MFNLNLNLLFIFFFFFQFLFCFSSFSVCSAGWQRAGNFQKIFSEFSMIIHFIKIIIMITGILRLKNTTLTSSHGICSIFLYKKISTLKKFFYFTSTSLFFIKKNCTTIKTVIFIMNIDAFIFYLNLILC